MLRQRMRGQSAVILWEKVGCDVLSTIVHESCIECLLPAERLLVELPDSRWLLSRLVGDGWDRVITGRCILPGERPWIFLISSLAWNFFHGDTLSSGRLLDGSGLFHPFHLCSTLRISACTLGRHRLVVGGQRVRSFGTIDGHQRARWLRRVFIVEEGALACTWRKHGEFSGHRRAWVWINREAGVVHVSDPLREFFYFYIKKNAFILKTPPSSEFRRLFIILELIISRIPQ